MIPLFSDPLYARFDIERKFRYRLGYVVRPTAIGDLHAKAHIAIILQNPSKAGTRAIPHDETTKEVIRKLTPQAWVGTVGIVNLDPAIGSSLPFSREAAKHHWVDNEKYMREELACADAVICAWGTGHAISDFAKEKILPLLREHRVPLAVFSENGKPYHPKPRAKNKNLVYELHHITEVELELS